MPAQVLIQVVPSGSDEPLDPEAWLVEARRLFVTCEHGPQMRAVLEEIAKQDFTGMDTGAVASKALAMVEKAARIIKYLESIA